MATLQTSGHAPVNGISMYYEIYGEGTIPLVLIHGGGSTIETTFSKLLPLLSAHYKVIAVELQAHGRTSDRDAQETFEQDADDVAALLKYLKVEKANFLGFSNGGTTTMQIAIRHAALVNKIIVVSANYQREGMMTGFFDGMQHATIDNMPASLKEAFLKVTPDKAKLQTMFEKDKARMINFKDIADSDIKNIKAPTLLIVGDRDVVTVSHALKISQLIAGARLAVLPADHGGLIGEADTNATTFEATAKLATDFLSVP